MAIAVICFAIHPPTIKWREMHIVNVTYTVYKEWHEVSCLVHRDAQKGLIVDLWCHSLAIIILKPQNKIEVQLENWHG